ncbi:hypothetical protein OROGR_024657 [Orobanche gracilis]
MSRQILNLDGKIGGRRKYRVRKRCCSSSSSSSLHRNYRSKRVFRVGRRVGSSTPVPDWKMSSSRSPLAGNDERGGERAKVVSVSARKLAATLWEIDGVKREENLDEEINERMDLQKRGSHRRRASVGTQRTPEANYCHLGCAKSIHDCLVEGRHDEPSHMVDQTQNHFRRSCSNLIGSKNRLKDVYNGLVTSKELLKVMGRVFRSDQHHSPTSLSLFTALKSELDRACAHVTKLVQERKTSQCDVDILLKHFEEERILWKLKEQDKIRRAMTSMAGELDAERKLRRQTERLNTKLGRDLAETKGSLLKADKNLEREKRAREILEQVCDELARGIGEDRAEVEEMKRRSAKVCEEVEKEREMLRLADILREERVQMKLSEAKYQFEEKNAVVDKLRIELEAYLKSKRGEEQENVSPSYDKIKELEKYLRETLPCSYEYEEKRKNEIEVVNNEDEDDEEKEDDSGDSDLHSIELSIDDIDKNFQWSECARKESNRNPYEEVRKVKKTFSSETKLGGGIEWENLGVFEKRGVFEFASQPWKKDIEDEIERYNVIKDLRDHIVLGSKMASSRDSASPGLNGFGQQNLHLEEHKDNGSVR